MEQIERKRSWTLRARDRKVLKQIGENGFSSARWIKEHFSTGKANCNHYRRLSVLRKRRLIEYMMGDCGKKLGYRLTKKGLQYLRTGRDSGDAIEYRAAYRTTYRHDDYLVGLGSVFRSLPGMLEYWPEHLVRKKLAQRYGFKERKGEGYKVPDAIFTVQTKQRQLCIALELEIAPKARVYYRRILLRLVKSRDFEMVFAVVPDVATMEVLKRELMWVRTKDPAFTIDNRDNGFYFALLSDVLTNKGESKFQGEGTAFTLRQLAS